MDNTNGIDEFIDKQEVKPGAAAVAVASIISRKHEDIGALFISKVMDALSLNNNTILDYGVKRSRGSWDTSSEFITLDINDGSNQRLVINLEHKGA